MDKMGSYDDGMHSNQGIPATPRDGADIEIVGLEAYFLQWLVLLCDQGYWKEQGILVNNENTQVFWSYHKWYELIKSSFERAFFIPATGSHGPYYCDCVNKEMRVQDRQLRPNYVLFPSCLTP